MIHNTIVSETIHIDAPAEKVWGIISDLAQMGKRSPQCKTMIVLGKEKTIGPGTTTLNINHRGLFWWVTRSRIIDYIPEKILSFRVLENRTVWKYEITPDGDGVNLSESRNNADSKAIHRKLLLLFGGERAFTEEIRLGIKETLSSIKTTAENS